MKWMAHKTWIYVSAFFLPMNLKVFFLDKGVFHFFTVSDISKRLGSSQIKTYRLVRTLIKYGFLVENPGTAQCGLDQNVLRLGLLAQRQFNISMIARLLMKELSLLSKETILLTALNGTKGMVIERVESEEPI